MWHQIKKLFLIDALINIPLEQILIELPISSKVKEALLERKNIYYELLNLIIEYEREIGI